MLLQACAQELNRGRQVWSHVVASDAVQAFQADPNGAAYLSALQHIWRIALLLQVAADLHGLTQAATSQHCAAFEAASRQSMEAVVGEYCAALCFAESCTPQVQPLLIQALSQYTFISVLCLL